MKEIKKHGQPPVDLHKRYETECPKCGCVFTYTYYDITVERRMEAKLYVLCPMVFCSQYIDHKA